MPSRILCIERIDKNGVAFMTDHMGRFVHFSHVSVLVVDNSKLIHK